MSTTVSLRLPNSIHRQLRTFAEQDGVSMNQFITLAVAEKIASLATAEYLEQRASQGNKSKFDSALANVPDAAPEDQDKL